MTGTRTPRPRAGTLPQGPAARAASSGPKASSSAPGASKLPLERGPRPAGSPSTPDVELAPEWAELLDAWAAWSRQPGDRAAAIRLSEASAPVAPALGVPAYRVGVVLADGLRQGVAHADVVARLAEGWRP